MDKCNVFIIDSNGNKRPCSVNLNNTLKAFLRIAQTITGTENTSISLGDQIHGRDKYESTLRSLGVTANMDIELMTSFQGGKTHN